MATLSEIKSQTNRTVHNKLYLYNVAHSWPIINQCEMPDIFYITLCVKCIKVIENEIISMQCALFKFHNNNNNDDNNEKWLNKMRTSELLCFIGPLHELFHFSNSLAITLEDYYRKWHEFLDWIFKKNAIYWLLSNWRTKNPSFTYSISSSGS